MLLKVKCVKCIDCVEYFEYVCGSVVWRALGE